MREQRLVGADKVLLFVRSIDHAEREVIGIELEEDDGVNGLTEDWSKVRMGARNKESRQGSASEPGSWRRMQLSKQCSRRGKIKATG